MATKDWKELEGKIFRIDVASTTEEALKNENPAVISFTTDGDIVFNGEKFCKTPDASNGGQLGLIKTDHTPVGGKGINESLTTTENVIKTLSKNYGQPFIVDGVPFYPILAKILQSSSFSLSQIKNIYSLVTGEEVYKLKNIEENANKYVLPSATSSTLGGVKKAALDLQSEYEFLKTAPTITEIDDAKIAINHLRIICKTLVDKLEAAGTLTK